MKRKKPAIPLDGVPEEKKAKTDEILSKTGPKVDQSVRKAATYNSLVLTLLKSFVTMSSKT